MEGDFGRSGLIAPLRLKALSARSDLKGAAQMAGHLGALAATGTVLHLTWGDWWALPAFLAHGIVLNFLYAAQHELSHATPFRTVWLNEVFGRAIGFAMLYPRDFDRIQHFAHHRHTQDRERDGELAGRPRYTLASYLLWLSGLSYWWSRVARILRLARGVVVEPYVRDAERPAIVREARWHLGGYLAIAAASLMAESGAAVLYWIAPLVVAKPVHQLQNTIEHLGLTHSKNTLSNTRTIRTNRVLRWLGWNMAYHTAHHCFPAVPFHALPALHAEIVERSGRQPPTMGYIEFQVRVIAALARGGEVAYADDRTWVASKRTAA